MSETASGTFAGVLTFSQRKSGQQVRFQHPPSGQPSAGQLFQRQSYRNLFKLWNAMPQIEKDYWKEIEKKGYADV